MSFAVTRLVVFDLDGTLVDSRHDIALAANLTLESLGLARLSDATVVGFVGGGVKNLALRCLRAATPSSEEPPPPDTFVERFMPIYSEHLLDRTLPYPGVVETLATLRETGVETAVVTNKPSAPARKIVEGLKLGPFAILVGGDSMPVRKPDPEPLLAALGHVGAAVHDALYVGDMAVDVQTARAAGVPFVGVTWGIGKRTDMETAGARDFVDHMRELLDRTGIGATRGDGVTP